MSAKDGGKTGRARLQYPVVKVGTGGGSGQIRPEHLLTSAKIGGRPCQAGLNHHKHIQDPGLEKAWYGN